MRTLNISISDFEYNRLGLKSDNLSFTDFVDLLGREISKQTLRRSVDIAEKHGLAGMTTEDIDKEVKAVRNAQNRR